LAFGSCETLAPKVFVLEKNKRINPKVKIESETGANFESILAAAQTCPTKAIKIVDRYTGEQIYPRFFPPLTFCHIPTKIPSIICSF
jgi:ferredoxin